MGIFNEQSFDHPFARGIQGAPGVGFNLTSSRDYDMINKKLRNVGAPNSNTDAASKKYVDDNSGDGKTSLMTVDSDIDMKDTYRILNLKSPSDADEAATKSYTDNNFLKTDGTKPMKQDLSLGSYRITHLGDPTGDGDATSKKYTDNLVNTKLNDYIKKDGTVAMTGDFNTGGHKILNLRTPSSNSEPATKYYVDNNFLNLDGTEKMTGNLDMNNNRILNLPAPTGGKQPTPLAFTDMKYLHVAGTNKMTNNLNMDNKKIINLRPPTSNTDAATKKYVDDSIPNTSSFIKKDGSVSMTNNLNIGNNKIVGLATPTSNPDAATKKYVDDNTGSPDLSDYLEKDDTVAMTGDLNVGNNKIKNLSNPTQDKEATTKDYVDKLIHHTAVQPSHYNNQFAYLMSSAAQWTDEINTGTSFIINKIDDLPPNKGNFHNYNHKVIYMTVIKNSQGGYKLKMGINFYRLLPLTSYTLCLELLSSSYQELWNKTQISVDKGTSTGLSVENVSVKKLAHRYFTTKPHTNFMFYHRIIINFRKLSYGNKYFLHILVNIPQVGNDLRSYPNRVPGIYMIACGIVGFVSNIDPDKVYDYHIAFDIKPTEVVYKVDINANQKEIKNIKLDRLNDNSAATVALVKELAPFTKNALYRLYFSEVYDFANADSYGINIGSSGVIINSVKPNITLPPNKDLSEIKKDGLNVNGYDVTFSPSHSSKSTLCIVFSHWRNRSFTLTKYLSTNNSILLKLNYNKTNNKVILTINKATQNFTMLSEFNGKIIVLWLTENFDTNVTKVKISNYSSTLTIPAVQYNVNQRWKFTTEDGVLNKLMYSPNFYDFDSEQFHKVMLQEKLSGSCIV